MRQGCVRDAIEIRKECFRDALGCVRDASGMHWGCIENVMRYFWIIQGCFEDAFWMHWRCKTDSSTCGHFWSFYDPFPHINHVVFRRPLYNAIQQSSQPLSSLQKQSSDHTQPKLLQGLQLFLHTHRHFCTKKLQETFKLFQSVSCMQLPASHSLSSSNKSFQSILNR